MFKEVSSDGPIVAAENQLHTQLSSAQLVALRSFIQEAIDPYLQLPLNFTPTSTGYLYATAGLRYYLLGLPHSPHLLLFERDLVGYRRCVCSCGVAASSLKGGGYSFSDPIHAAMYRTLRLAPFSDAYAPCWLEHELVNGPDV